MEEGPSRETLTVNVLLVVDGSEKLQVFCFLYKQTKKIVSSVLTHELLVSQKVIVRSKQ